MSHVVYIIGYPGVGKSTALGSALSSWHHVSDEAKPFAYRVFCEGIVLGADRPGFPGTDTLSMSVNPKAIQFVKDTDGLIVGEGDRLANIKFLAACPTLTLVHLDAAPSLARARARVRAASLGTKEQSDSWWKGRVTKVDNLLARFPHVTIDASDGKDQVAKELSAVLARATPAS